MTVTITHSTPADSSFSTTGAAAWNADHTLTGVGTMAEQNADSVAITGGAIDNTVIGGTTPAAGTFTTLTATGQTSLGGAAGSEGLRVLKTSSSVNWVQAAGAVTGSNPVITGQGGDTEVGLDLAIRTGGFNYTRQRIGSTGNIDFSLNAAGGQAMRTTITSSQVNYVQVTGAATGSNPTISAQGSDANVSLTFLSKASSGIYFQTRGGGTARNALVLGDNGAASVNYLTISSNVASSAPILSATGSDTNIDLSLTTKGTGSVNLNTGSGVGFKVLDAGVAGNYWAANAYNVSPALRVDGSSTNIDATLTTKGTGNFLFKTNTFGQEQFRVSHTASAVNYVQVTGAATGNATTISTQGSDSSITSNYSSKGPFSQHIFLINGYTSFQVSASNGVVANRLSAQASLTGFGPVLSAQGSDTNIPLVLQPKGTGALQAQQTDSTATGGNARGANAVDWQMVRNAASQVASSSQAAIGGGGYNTASGYASFIGAGNTNANTATYGAILGGQANTVSKDWSVVVGGQANTAAGYYNLIGGGFTNSGTASAAVTTQSGTMNGTTAVTLSGSNAAIKVGQYITGTSIASDTYVAAISGTSLTLSKVASGSSTSTLSFYTPHGIVVGGGNNQATGSYSFIGGGGDAGTASNRNVASGDWSVVGGGLRNTASGNGSFIGAGNYAGGSNTASGQNSFIGSGYANTASSNSATVLAGHDNIANGGFSSVLGGAYGNSRSTNAYFVFPSSAPIASNSGVTQAGLLVIGVQTTDATATVLRADGGAAGTTNQVILPNNSAYYFKVEIIANVTGGGNTSGWELKGVIKRGANAASTAIVGSVTSTLIAQDAGASTWAVSATADTTNGGLKITVTGQAATTIRWVAKASTTEVTY